MQGANAPRSPGRFIRGLTPPARQGIDLFWRTADKAVRISRQWTGNTRWWVCHPLGLPDKVQTSGFS